MKSSLSLLALVLFLLAGPAQAQEKAGPMMQAFIGSLKLDDQSAQWVDVGDEKLDIEFPSSMPSGGIEAEYRYGGQAITWGINSGGSIALKSSDTRVSGGFSGSTGGVIRVDIDNALFIGELHLGGFVRGQLGEDVSVYAAAGPMLMYGKHEVEDEEIEAVEPHDNGQVEITNTDEADFAFGYYGRAGIDFRYSKTQYFGLGVRYMAAELDFSNTLGDVHIEGPQIVLTYTAQL